MIVYRAFAHSDMTLPKISQMNYLLFSCGYQERVIPYLDKVIITQIELLCTEIRLLILIGLLPRQSYCYPDRVIALLTNDF